MESRNISSLMLPFLVFLAVLFPAATVLRMSSAGGEKAQTGGAILPKVEEKGSADGSTKPEPKHDAATILREFFGPTAGIGGLTKSYFLDFIIATLPDPVDSRLPYFFDSFTDSIQRSVEATGYVLDRFDLPWGERNTTLGSSLEKPRFETEPGLLLFRHSNPTEKKLLLLFLVGETPTSGIHKPAFTNALDQIAQQLYGWNGPSPYIRVSLPEVDKEGKYSIKVLGPTFSGSAVSMQLALRGWLRETTGFAHPPEVSFRIVSGTATAINPSLFSDIEIGRAIFQATVPPDARALKAFVQYLQENEGHKIALLTEGNTSYGGAFKKDIETLMTKKPKSGIDNSEVSAAMEILTLPFPLHISQLRRASEKEKQSRQESKSEVVGQRSTSLPLPQEEGPEPQETVPSFASLTTPSADLILSNLLSAISKEQYRYVGILATDVQDTIFLAEEIHQHCPGTLTFTFNTDLLYTHPEAIPSTQGMLMITPYPLFSLNQLWVYPFDGDESRLQFPNQAAEGVYNAMLALLGQEDRMVEYGVPFENNTGEDSPRQPTLWVTVVSKNGMLPLTFLDWQNIGYSLPISQLDQKDTSKLKIASLQGVYTPGAIAAVIALSVCFTLFSRLITKQYPLDTAPKEIQINWVSRLFGETLAPEYRLQCRLFLLAGCVSVCSFYLVTISAFFLPVFARLKQKISFEPNGIIVVFVGLISALTLWMLVQAIVQLYRSFKTDLLCGQRLAREVAVALVVVVACAAVLCLSVWLAGSWLAISWKRPANLVFIYLRAFNWQSGLSPVVPFLFITAAALLWALGSFRRLRLIDRVHPAIDDPPPAIQPTKESRQKNDLCFNFLAIENSSLNGAREMEKDIRYVLASISIMSLRSYSILLAVALCAALYFFHWGLIRAFECSAFYWLFKVSFFVVYWALLMEFLRLVLVWHRLRQFLLRLSWHPMRASFKRYRESFPSLPKLNLTMTDSLIELEFSIEQARRLLLLGSALAVEPETSKPISTMLLEWTRNAEPEVQKAGAILAKALEVESAEKLAKWFEVDAWKKLTKALEMIARPKLVKVLEVIKEMALTQPEGEKSKYNWRVSLQSRCLAQCAVARVSNALGDLMEPYWMPPEGTPPQRHLTKREKEFFVQAEEFIAGRAVHFLSYVFPSVRNLGGHVLGGLLLMLFGVASYTFYSRDQFLLFNWIVILTFIGVASIILVQMERDVVLSDLNGTTPGQITWNREFVFRILIYVVVPILALLGVQFPKILSRLISVLGGTQGG